MTDFDYDLFVIGAGSGGVRASRVAASHGARVAVAEEYRIGGTCVIRGCVPKKLFVYASHFSEEFEAAAGFGWTVGKSKFDWPTLIANKDREIERLSGIYVSNLEKAGVTLIRSRAVLRDRHSVHLVAEDRHVTAKYILIATGATPNVDPGLPGVELAITSNEAFHLDRMPERIVIAGGGYIAVEFAGIFNGLGSETHLMFRSPKVLPDFDQDIRDTLQEEMARRGVLFHTGERIKTVQQKGSALAVETDSGQTLEVDCVMLATGRVPATTGMGLEEVGIKLADNGAVMVDDQWRTNLENIYAIGDCIDRVQLTPVAIAEGRALAENLYNQNAVAVSYENIPTAVFSIPPVGTVGLTQEQARGRCSAGVDIYRARFRPMKYTLPDKDTKAMLKLVVDRGNQRVVGCHMVGEPASELIQALAVCVVCGATKADFDRTIAVHPSTAEEFVLMRRPSESLEPIGV
ncbi:MAG: glutathione-disulfide reductase [Candidatus Eremiobacteraeota bacterium]|nr:glutathione-disulfide reductase [Candidatus Eremiobacteraeota bacterium]